MKKTAPKKQLTRSRKSSAASTPRKTQKVVVAKKAPLSSKRARRKEIASAVPAPASSHRNLVNLQLSTSPFSVTSFAISRLRDRDLVDLMSRLLDVECRKLGADASLLTVSDNLTASDDGADASSPSPPTPGDWLPGQVCWQFKAGDAGSPSRIKGEIKKRLPTSALRDGGYFILVASGSNSGEKGQNARLKVLVNEAKSIRPKLPKGALARIRVLSADRIAAWLNQNLPVLLDFTGASAGSVFTINRWKALPQFSGPWSPSERLTRARDSVHADLSLTPEARGGGLHIYGYPGVGKTRFVLEVLNVEKFRGSTIYLRVPDFGVVDRVISNIAAYGGSHVVVVIDEVPLAAIQQLHDLFSAISRQASLITIGHQKPATASGLKSVLLEPLDSSAISALVRTSFPALDLQAVAYVARFSDGYARLAILVADALSKNPSLSTPEIFGHEGVRDILLRQMLGDDAAVKHALMLVALFTSIRWERAQGEEKDELTIVCSYLGQSVDGVRAAVRRAMDNGIVQIAGDLIYVTPQPLAEILANEAVVVFRDLVPIPDNLLPSGLVSQHTERLAAIAASPRFRPYVTALIERISTFKDLHRVTIADSFRLAALNNPNLAATKLMQLLEDASEADRKSFIGKARRILIDAMDYAAQFEEAFSNAATSLALLAEYENETWGNNSRGQFIEKFRILNSGTAVSYDVRLEVLSALLESSSSSICILALSALAESLSLKTYRALRSDTGGRPGIAEWRPEKWNTVYESMNSAIDLLSAQIAKYFSSQQTIFLEAAFKAYHLLSIGHNLPFVRQYVLQIAEQSPEARDILHLRARETLDWAIEVSAEDSPKRLEAPSFKTLEEISDALRDRSDWGQLKELLLVENLQPSKEAIAAAAAIVSKDPTLLERYWAWITSGKAGQAYALGEELTSIQFDESNLVKLLDLAERGPDNRLIVGFFQSLRKKLGSAWADQFLDRLENGNERDLLLVIEIIWRIQLGDSGATRIVRIFDSKKLAPQYFKFLGNGFWFKDVSNKLIAEIAKRFMTSPELSFAAIMMIYSTMRERGDILAEITDVATELVTNNFTQYTAHIEWCWAEIAKKLAKTAAAEISQTIFRAQFRSPEARKLEERSFFIEHHHAKDVLETYADIDPIVVWKSLLPFFEDREARRFGSIGFPASLIAKFPAEVVLKWIRTSPAENAEWICEMIPKVLEDGSLFTAIVSEFGKLKIHKKYRIADSYLQVLSSGSFTGEWSSCLNGIAQALESFSSKTNSPFLREWALRGAQSYKKSAVEAAVREAEESIRGRR